MYILLFFFFALLLNYAKHLNYFCTFILFILMFILFFDSHSVIRLSDAIVDELQMSEEEQHLLPCSVVLSQKFRGVLPSRPIKEQTVFIEKHPGYLLLGLLITMRINQ